MTANPRSHLPTVRSSPPMGRFRTCERRSREGHPMRSSRSRQPSRTRVRRSPCATRTVSSGIPGMRPVAMSPSSVAAPMQAIPTLDARLRSICRANGSRLRPSPRCLHSHGKRRSARKGRRLLPGRRGEPHRASFWGGHLPCAAFRTHARTRTRQQGELPCAHAARSSPRYGISTSYAPSSSIRASCAVASSWPMPRPTVPNAP